MDIVLWTVAPPVVFSVVWILSSVVGHWLFLTED
jgi:hypothetical protein